MTWQGKYVDIKQLEWVDMVLTAEVEQSGETWMVSHTESIVLGWLVAFEMLRDIWAEGAEKQLLTRTQKIGLGI